MQLSIIVAAARNLAIGRENRLLWHISEDLRYFKSITSGHTVVMGRKTYEAIGRPLPHRRNIVISRGLPAQAEVEVAASLHDALARAQDDGEVFVIGGGEVYREALPLAQRIYYTEVHADYAADTFFPRLDAAQWQEISREDRTGGEQFATPFSFVVYERIGTA